MADAATAGTGSGGGRGCRSGVRGAKRGGAAGVEWGQGGGVGDKGSLQGGEGAKRAVWQSRRPPPGMAAARVASRVRQPRRVGARARASPTCLQSRASPPGGVTPPPRFVVPILALGVCPRRPAQGHCRAGWPSVTPRRRPRRSTGVGAAAGGEIRPSRGGWRSPKIIGQISPFSRQSNDDLFRLPPPVGLSLASGSVAPVFSENHIQNEQRLSHVSRLFMRRPRQSSNMVK